MLNKDYEIAIKKIIRFKRSTEWFYKLDKIFKLSKVEIVNVNDIRERNGGHAVNMTYKYGLRLLNPFTWILVIIPSILYEIYDSIMNIIVDLGSDEVTETLQINTVRDIKKL